jgi:hypothetical protein
MKRRTAIVGIVCLCLLLSVRLSGMLQPIGDGNQEPVNQSLTPSPSSSSDSVAQRTSLESDYDSISEGETRSQVAERIGRAPDLTYKATDGSGDTVLQFNGDGMTTLRVMLKGDAVDKVTYVPASGLENVKVK